MKEMGSVPVGREAAVIRLLIVDGHEVVRAGLRALLEDERDFEIVADCASADELGTKVDRFRPDIVLLAARLPGVSGAEATRRLRSSHPDVKVVALSSYTDDDLVDALIDAGACGYLVKDIERSELKQSIRRVARGEAVFSPAVAGRFLDRVRARDHEGPPVRPTLTESKRIILRLLAEGCSNREIAARVHLSQHTVKSHVQEIFRTLQVRNRVEATTRGLTQGLI